MKNRYHHHWIRDCHSTFLPELDKKENCVAVYKRKYWDSQKTNLYQGDRKLKKESKFYAFIRLRDKLPNAVGEGRTMDLAVDDLVVQLLISGGLVIE